MRAPLSIVALLLLTACGEFHNDPLREGIITGRVLGADRQVALAALFGDPDRRASVEDDGRFELDEVPAGSWDVYVIADAGRAIRRTVQLDPGEIEDLGDLTAPAAASVTVTVEAEGHQAVDDAVVWIQDAPLPVAEIDEVPTVTLGPLAEGCYVVEGFAEGLERTTVDFCVAAGEARALTLRFPRADGSSEEEGCDRTGCEDGYVCLDDGNCG